jgi:hypothetical protein
VLLLALLVAIAGAALRSLPRAFCVVVSTALGSGAMLLAASLFGGGCHEEAATLALPSTALMCAGCALGCALSMSCTVKTIAFELLFYLPAMLLGMWAATLATGSAAGPLVGQLAMTAGMLFGHGLAAVLVSQLSLRPGRV